MSELDELVNPENWKVEEVFGKYGVVHDDVFTGSVDIQDAAAELAALTERVGRLEWVVKRLEFIEEYPSEDSLCPICRGEKPTHYEDCELAAALQEAQ